MSKKNRSGEKDSPPPKKKVSRTLQDHVNEAEYSLGFFKVNAGNVPPTVWRTWIGHAKDQLDLALMEIDQAIVSK